MRMDVEKMVLYQSVTGQLWNQRSQFGGKGSEGHTSNDWSLLSHTKGERFLQDAQIISNDLWFSPNSAPSIWSLFLLFFFLSLLAGSMLSTLHLSLLQVDLYLETAEARGEEKKYKFFQWTKFIKLSCYLFLTVKGHL